MLDNPEGNFSHTQPQDYSRMDYFNHPDNQFQPEPSHTPRRKTLTILFALVLAAAVLVAVQLVFHVTDISVTGASHLSPEEIIQLSGIRKGQNTFFVNHDKAVRNLAQSRYIKSSSIEVHAPGTVVINVKERIPRAYVCHNGFYIVIDSDGMILEEYANMTKSMAQLVRIEGLTFSYPEIGTLLNVKDKEVILGVREVLVEIAVKRMQGIITEINVSGTGGIFLGTCDGYSVRMGDRLRIHAKLEATKQVRLVLCSEGNPGEGTIDVSNPEKPVYIPVTQIQINEKIDE